MPHEETFANLRELMTAFADMLANGDTIEYTDEQGTWTLRDAEAARAEVDRAEARLAEITSDPSGSLIEGLAAAGDVHVARKHLVEVTDGASTRDEGAQALAALFDKAPIEDKNTEEKSE